MKLVWSLRVVLIFALSTPLLWANSLSEIDQQLDQASSRLGQLTTQENRLENRVENLSRDITQATKHLQSITQDLRQSERAISTLRAEVDKERHQYEQLQGERETLQVARDRIERQLVELMARHISQSLVFSGGEPAHESDLIKEAIFEAVKSRSGREIETLQDDFVDHQKLLDRIQSRIAEMTQRRDRLAQTRDRQSRLQAEQQKTLHELDRQKQRYLAEINELIDQRNRQRQMLADLNVIRQQAVDNLRQNRVSQEEAQRQARLSAQERAKQLEVRQLGSSYQAASQGRYRGQKVKPPLDDRYHITLTKDFGPYTDPIYNIRIHNDSVTLKADENDAVVRSVLGGTVVFAEDMKLLGRVVILEHPGNLHTIYRNLEEIAPHVRVGQSIRARQSIGRVNHELVFEVTKDGLPINPMQLIALPR